MGGPSTRRVPKNQHRLSTLTIVEAEDGALVEVVVETNLAINNKISKIKTTQKIQDVVEEEEIKEQGGAQEEDMDGNIDKAMILMYFGFVAILCDNLISY